MFVSDDSEPASKRTRLDTEGSEIETTEIDVDSMLQKVRMLTLTLVFISSNWVSVLCMLTLVFISSNWVSVLCMLTLVFISSNWVSALCMLTLVFISSNWVSVLSFCYI